MTASTPSWPPGTSITGTPPPPTQTTRKPASTSSAIAPSWTISRGSGEGTTRRQESPSGLDRPPPLGGQLLGASLVVDGTDELGRIAESRVVAVDDHAGDQGDRVLVVDLVVELELDDVADLPAALGVEDVERVGLALA